jgi:hypothetical protein
MRRTANKRKSLGPGEEQVVMAGVRKGSAAAGRDAGEGASSEVSAWIREHRCTYDIQPLVEKKRGRTIHVGYEVNLHAELPVTEQITEADARRVVAIRDRLGEILESLIPKDVEARIQRVPFRASVRFPRGTTKNPMVTRSAAVYPPNYASVEPGDREKFGPTEKCLREMGFKKA